MNEARADAASSHDRNREAMPKERNAERKGEERRGRRRKRRKRRRRRRRREAIADADLAIRFRRPTVGRDLELQKKNKKNSISVPFLGGKKLGKTR